MSEFYNPYHFVPVEARNSAQKGASVSCETFRSGQTPKHLTHDRYTEGTLSGRIVAEISTITPVVVGGNQERIGNNLANVEPYLVNRHPAVPASSLRGLISSTMEALTNAPLRVLTDRPFSYRKKMTQALSAIGLIVNQGHELRLTPMCLPTLDFDLNVRHEVTEISFSAIWRGRVEDSKRKAATSWTFFQAIDPELLPFHRERKSISVAEQILGFVQDTKVPEIPKDAQGLAATKPSALAMASRLRFSDAVPPDGEEMADILAGC